MVALRGQCLNCAECWEWRYERRYQGAGTAYLVCRTFTLVEVLQMRKAPTHDQAHGAYGEQLSFLPTPEFSPKWPKHTTVAGIVLGELLQGSFLDHQDLIDGVSSWRLAAYINKLKNDGWPIQALEKPAPSEQCPNRCIASYALPPAVIAKVQEMRGAA
jgi:hypothetical protein